MKVKLAMTFLFLATAYLPDPIPWLDELALSTYIATQAREMLLIILPIFALTTACGVPPFGLLL